MRKYEALEKAQEIHNSLWDGELDEQEHADALGDFADMCKEAGVDRDEAFDILEGGSLTLTEYFK